MKITEINISKPDFIYSAIHLLANRLQTLGDKIDPSITTKQWFVLAAVSKFEKTAPNIGDIAQLLGTSRQNIKKLAVILEERGFLLLKRDEADLRNINLYLTECCFTYFKSREQQEEEYFEKLFYGIKEETLEGLHDGLSRLIENMDRMSDGDEYEDRKG